MCFCVDVTPVLPGRYPLLLLLLRARYIWYSTIISYIYVLHVTFFSAVMVSSSMCFSRTCCTDILARSALSYQRSFLALSMGSLGSQEGIVAGVEQQQRQR